MVAGRGAVLDGQGGDPEACDGRLIHLILFTVVKEECWRAPERNRGLSLGCHQGIRAGPYSVAPIDALKRWRASVV